MLFNRRNRSRSSRRPVQPFTLPARWKAVPRLEALDERIVPAFLTAVDYPVGTNPNAVVTGDFTGDGVDDLAVASWGNQTVSVLPGNADGSFQPAVSSPAGNYPTSLAVGDFNGDGKLDLVTGDPSYGSAADVSVLLGNGDGSFQAPAAIDINYYGYWGYADGAGSVAVGDFNGDGKLDLGVVSNYAWGSYYGSGVLGMSAVLLGTGTGTFGTPNWSWLVDGYNTDATVADFNADGKLDIATVSDYGYVYVGLGAGNGYFDYQYNYYYVGASPFSVVAADLNADGKLDLATANYYSDSVSVLLGTGTGTFGAAQNYTAGSYPSSVAAADFNGDNVLDLITTDAGSASVSVLLGTGSGAFKPPVSAAAGSTPWGVAVGDFNKDGKADAASANNSSAKVSVLINDGVWPSLDSPSISVTDRTVAEGNTGTVDAAFTVTLSAASSKTVTVSYATVDGSATTAGGDYQAASGTLTFAPGETSKTITVLVNGDRVVEYTESFLVVLTNPANAFVADAKGVGSITDDEPRASIDYGPVYVTEGNSGTTNAVFTVRLSNAYDEPVDVGYSTSNGSAAAGSDYQAVNDTVTFAPGETVKTISVPVIGDRVAEYDESFYVTLSGGSGYGYAVIRDNEPRLGINSASATEGNAGTTTMTFTVTLSAAYDEPVTVGYSTSNGSATAGNDYESANGTLTFAPGETTKTVTVTVNGDRLSESDESLYVVLSGASGNAMITNSYGYGTIRDDEPRISIGSASVTEGHRGLKAMTFTVSLAVAYDEVVTVDFATQSYSGYYYATAGQDFEAASGTLTFAPGETSKTITVWVKGDKKREPNESLYVLLSNASSNATIVNAYGWGTIVNDDNGNGPKG
jgi:hypothetical protein